MSTPIVCAECGIRYGEHMDACPWCGRAETASLSLAPPPQSDAGVAPAPARVQTVAPPAPPPPRPTHNGAPRIVPPAPPAPPPNGQAERVAAQANLLDTPPAPAAAAGTLKRAGVWAAAVLGCLVLGALLAEFAPLGFLTSGVDEPAQLQPPVVVVPVDPVDAAPPAAEAPPATAAPSSVAEAPPPEAPAIEPVGEPIALADLALGVDGIGELEIGSDADTVLGRLVATFGAPDDDRALVSDGTFSGCPGEAVRVVRWGTLAVTTVPGSEGEVFAGYRVDLDFADGSTGPALETISGLRAGDTVADLQRVYAELDLQFFEAADGTVFELRRPSDGTLLLTGPLTGADPASLVRGIYSPDLCV